MSNAEDFAANFVSLISDEDVSSREMRGRLKQMLSPIRPIKLVDTLSKEWITAIYITRSLLNDLYRNIGTDATFSFPEELVAEHKVIDYLKSFLQELLTSDDRPSPKAIDNLCNAVNSYYAVLREIDRNIDKYK